MALRGVKLPSTLGRVKSSLTSLNLECDRNRVSLRRHLPGCGPQSLAVPLLDLCRAHCSYPMRFFPPLDKNRWAWRARMEALQGQDAHEDSPTMVHLTAYLLALDELYDR